MLVIEGPLGRAHRRPFISDRLTVADLAKEGMQSQIGDCKRAKPRATRGRKRVGRGRNRGQAGNERGQVGHELEGRQGSKEDGQGTK